MKEEGIYILNFFILIKRLPENSTVFLIKDTIDHPNSLAFGSHHMDLCNNANILAIHETTDFLLRKKFPLNHTTCCQNRETVSALLYYSPGAVNTYTYNLGSLKPSRSGDKLLPEKTGSLSWWICISFNKDYWNQKQLKLKSVIIYGVFRLT